MANSDIANGNAVKTRYLISNSQNFNPPLPSLSLHLDIIVAKIIFGLDSQIF